MGRRPGCFTIQKKALTARDRLWLSMRILRRFTMPQACATAGLTEDNARRYLIGLERAGFVRVVLENDSGKAGSFKTYALVKDTGPSAPILRKDGSTYDRNTRTVFPGA
jgi:hypothetical protein